MTPYGLFILISLLLSFTLDTLAGLLNIRALGAHPPAPCAERIDAATWSRTRACTRDREVLDRTAATVKLAALLAWWFAGGFAWLDRIVTEWEMGVLGSGVAYIGLLLLLSKLV
ncbi:MAG: M48 family peptidase, partial [Magnetococcales bacterium]|nr:M48 family peptidase [Magnetococcales bacterium]